MINNLLKEISSIEDEGRILTCTTVSKIEFKDDIIHSLIIDEDLHQINTYICLN